jgi:hypothetical protein
LSATGCVHSINGKEHQQLNFDFIVLRSGKCCTKLLSLLRAIQNKVALALGGGAEECWLHQMRLLLTKSSAVVHKR